MAKFPEENQTLQILKQQLKERKLGNFYIFFGEEAFLLQYYLEQMKKQLLDELTESFNYHKFTGETFHMQAFADAVENLPMMAEHTLVVLDDIDLFKMGESEREKLTCVFSDIPEYCTVVAVYQTVPWKLDKRYKKLSDAITANAMIVEFPKQAQRDLIPWITRHFAAAQKKIPTDLCVYLIEITGGTMTALAGEIEKICAYSGADVIKKSDIDAVTEPVLDAAVLQMTNYLGQGNYAMALQNLHKLLKQQEEPLMILGSIGAQFRRISAAKILIDNGKGAGDFMKLYGASDYAARRTMDNARRFSAEFCKKAAERIVLTDHQIKTSVDEPSRLLEMLLLYLAQEARNG